MQPDLNWSWSDQCSCTGQEFLEFLRAAAAGRPVKALAIAGRGGPPQTSAKGKEANYLFDELGD